MPETQFLRFFGYNSLHINFWSNMYVFQDSLDNFFKILYQTFFTRITFWCPKISLKVPETRFSWFFCKNSLHISFWSNIQSYYDTLDDYTHFWYYKQRSVRFVLQNRVVWACKVLSIWLLAKLILLGIDKLLMNSERKNVYNYSLIVRICIKTNLLN